MKWSKNLKRPVRNRTTGRTMKGSPALSQKRRTSMPHYSFVKELRVPVPYSRPEHPSSMNNRLTEKGGLRPIAEPSLNQVQSHLVGFAEPRSEERRVGKEWVSTCRLRGWRLN